MDGPSYSNRRRVENLDRFIPNRSAMNFDFAHYMLTQGGRKVEQKDGPGGGYGEGYKKLIAQTLDMDRSRILAFKNSPPEPVTLLSASFSADTAPAYRPQKKKLPLRRHIHQTANWALDASGILQDELCSNLLDWGSNNVISIVLYDTVYLWDASSCSISKELFIANDANGGPVSSVRWSPDAKHIAVGLSNSDIQLWDAASGRLLRTLEGAHHSRVGSLDWNKNLLTSGGMDGSIINSDVRVRSHVVQAYRGHNQQVCALKWSSSGLHLASGGNDELLHIWDASMATSQRWLHRFRDHTAAVKGLAWCPFEADLLASGAQDGCVKFWKPHTGACLNSVDTGSQVCGLLWNTNEKELLSAHGYTQNQLTLWDYPSMVRIAELTGHTSPVLHMAQSPNGCTVATASPDESMRMWNVFGDPEMEAKPAPPRAPEPFANFALIR